MPTTNITAHITADDRGFQQVLNRSQAASRSWGERMTALRTNVVSNFASIGSGATGGLLDGVISAGAMARLGGVATVATAAAGAVAAIGYAGAKAFGESADMEDMLNALSAASDGSSSLSEQLDVLKGKLNQPGMSLGLMIPEVAAFQAANQGFDKSVQLVTELGNAYSLAGKSGNELNATVTSVAEGLRKMLSNQSIEDAQLDKVTESAPFISAMLMDKFGASTAAAMRNLDGGAPSPQALVDGLLEELSKLDRAKESSNTRVARVGKELDQLKVAVGERLKGAGDVIVEKTADVIAKFNQDAGATLARDLETPEQQEAKKKAFAERQEAREKAKQEAADKAMKDKEAALELAYKEADLKEQIAKIEMDGKSVAADQRIELALLKDIEKVKKELKLTDQEAKQFVTDLTNKEIDLLEIQKRKTAETKSEAAVKKASELGYDAEAKRHRDSGRTRKADRMERDKKIDERAKEYEAAGIAPREAERLARKDVTGRISTKNAADTERHRRGAGYSEDGVDGGHGGLAWLKYEQEKKRNLDPNNRGRNLPIPQPKKKDDDQGSKTTVRKVEGQKPDPDSRQMVAHLQSVNQKLDQLNATMAAREKTAGN
jgi:hypothetical protein